ncbi:creatininase family protein [Pseudomaricurvus alcaniphilus]|uniref:creatininase family protein n=1 Tax=Pseudomaricurvus alcaniphilus TaxID=1166482 RepID=UPI00140B4E4B|nr:creatininase family protein [Pseudomaricurvus alcaniphilus]NHN39328.1 creatininase family protein [Pseudomaricurvus alcaniphilus]
MTQWYYQTWEEIQQLVQNGARAVILPVGATEQHGPHLGCGVDTSIADAVCRAVARKTATLLLPTLPYGCSIGHSRRWPGTIAPQPKTLIDVIKDMGDWVYASGLRKLFIVNAHVTNAAPLRCALEMLRAEHDDLMVAVINTPELSQRVRQAHFADAEDWHANDAETSLMLAQDLAMVRPEKCSASDDQDRTTDSVFSHPVNRTSSNGVTGYPSRADAGKGHQLFEWMVEDLAALIERGLSEQPPLSASYFEPVNQ